MDDTRQVFERSILIMEYLPGESMDYSRDLWDVAGLFATIHQIDVPAAQNHLIREDAPLTLIYEECVGLLKRYFDSDLAQPEIRDYLMDLKSWADDARSQETYYQQDPWPCIVNTEVNSGNFIVKRPQKTIHLVDWEMAPVEKRRFLKTYSRHLRDTLMDRVRLRDPFVYLRGISWSAMGWVAYQTRFSGMKNPDTWAKLQQYMNINFIRSLFDPFIQNKSL